MPETLPLPHRPSFDEADVNDAVVEKMLPEIVAWRQAQGRHFGEAKAREDLQRVLRHGEYDGYRLARDLEGANGDEDLVEILSGHFCHRSEANTAIVKQWVATNRRLIDALVRQFPMGARVSFRQSRMHAMQTGTVKSIYADEGRAVIEMDTPSDHPVINLEDLSAASLLGVLC